MKQLTRFNYQNNIVDVSFGGTNAVGGFDETVWNFKNSATKFPFVPKYGDPAIMPVQRSYAEMTINVSGSDLAMSWLQFDRNPYVVDANFVSAFLLPYTTTETAALYCRGLGFLTSITDWYRLWIDVSGGAVIKLQKKVASGATTDIVTSNFAIDLTKCYSVRVLNYGVYLKAKVWESSQPEPTDWLLSTIDTSLAGTPGSSWAGVGGSHSTIANRKLAVNFFGASSQSPNLLRYGETLSNAAWGKLGTMVCTAGTAVCPDGSTVGASRLAVTVGGDSAYQDVTMPGTSTIALSIYAFIGGTATNVSVSAFWAFGGTTQSIALSFNPQTGLIIGAPSASGATLIYGAVEPAARGWVRIKLSGRGSDPANTALRVQTYINSPAAGNWQAWGARLDLGSLFADYYPGIDFPITNPQYADWLNDITKKHVAVVEMSATGSSVVTSDYTKEVKYYSSDSGYQSKVGDVPQNRDYRERIKKLPSFGRSLGLALNGRGSVSTGSIVFLNPAKAIGSGGQYDDWLRRKWKKEPFKLLYGDEAWELYNFRPLLVGRLGQPSSDNEGEITFPIYDMTERFGDIFQNNLYTAAGQAQNKPKPYLIGIQDFIECVQYDSTNPLLFQFHDGASAGNVDKSSWLYDNAVSLVTPALTVSTVAANVITTTANHGLLVNHRLIWPTTVTPPTGITAGAEYWVITSPAANTFTLSASRGGAVQALTNGTGIGSTFNGFGFDINLTTGVITLLSTAIGRIVLRPTINQGVPIVGRTLGQIYSDIVFTKYGLSPNSKDSSSFAALDAATSNGQTFSTGAFFDTNQRTIGDACDFISKGSFSWYNWTNDGLMQVGLLGLPSISPVMSFTFDDLEIDSLKKIGGILPVDFTKALITYAPRNFSGGVFQTGDTAFRSLKDNLAKLPAQTSSTPIDNATQGDSKNPPTYDTIFSDSTKAAALQVYLTDLFGKQIGIFQFKTRLAATQLNIGQTIRLTHELEGWKVWTADNPASPDNTGYYDSTLAVVIGIDTDLSAETAFKVTLTVFRQVPMDAPTQCEDSPIPLVDVDMGTSVQPVVGSQVTYPIFSCNGNAMIKDFENNHRYTKPNEARFIGARRVENLVATSIDFYRWTRFGLSSFGPASQDKAPYYPSFDRDATEIQESPPFINTNHGIIYPITLAFNEVRQYSARVHYLPIRSGRRHMDIAVSDGSYTNFSGMHIAAMNATAPYVDGTTAVGAGFALPTQVAVSVATRGWALLAMTQPVRTSPGFNLGMNIRLSDLPGSGGPYIGDGAGNIKIWGGQLEDVMGQSNKAPSEFIETDMLVPNELTNSENPLGSNWNSIPTNSTIALCAAPDGSLTAGRVTIGSNWVSGALPFRIKAPARQPSWQRGAYYKYEIWMRKNAGSGTQLSLDINDSAVGPVSHTLTGAWQKFTGTMYSITSANTAIFLDFNLQAATWTAGDTIDIWHPTVLADPDDVLTVSHSLTGPALPFFGAMIDGVKYFKYKNGNVLSASPAPYGTFTESQGPVISRSILHGVLVERASSNLLSSSQWRNFSNASWTKTNVTVALASGDGIDGAPLSAYNLKLTSTAANGTCVLTAGLPATPHVYSLFIKRVSGTGNITLTCDNFVFSNLVINPTDTTQLVRFSIPVGSVAPIVGIKFAVSGDSIICDWNQLEDGTTMTSPMYPGVARPVTLLEYSAKRFPTNDFTLVYEFVLEEDAFGATVLGTYVDANNNTSINFQTASLLRLTRTVAGTAFVTNVSFGVAQKAGARFRCVVRISSNGGADFWVNGRRAVTNMQTLSTPIGPTWQIGGINGAVTIGTAGSRFIIHNNLLTDDQCFDLST